MKCRYSCLVDFYYVDFCILLSSVRYTAETASGSSPAAIADRGIKITNSPSPILVSSSLLMSTEFANPLADLDRWYERYSTAAPKEQYEMLQALIETPLSPEVLEDMDLGILLLDMREELVNNGLIDEAIALIEKLQQQQPELYKEEYPYHDKFRALYYLYSNQPEKIKGVLSHFKAYPETGIDEMLLILEELRFYNAAEIAVRCFCFAH